MKILVCIKEVPASESSVSVDSKEQWIEIKETTPFRINRFDEYAVEEAVRIKEKIPGSRVDVITIGPARAVEVVKRAIGMGADEGIHIVDNEITYKHPFDIASKIAGAVNSADYDLIFAGIMSEDMMHAQTGPMLAEILGLPCAVGVVKINDFRGSSAVEVEREMEGGLRDCLEMDLPALLTIQAGINKPRYPTLSNMLKARKKKIQTIPTTKSGALPELRARMTGVAYPVKSRAGKVLEGTCEEMADQLIDILKKRTIIN